MIKSSISSRHAGRTGILGGTFDPVHNGHLALADCTIREGMADRIWFLPNPRPPHKDLPADAASAGQRMEMLRLAIAGHDQWSICDLEMKKTTDTYTWQTLDALEELYPQLDYTFLIGADSLFLLDTWKCPERLLPGRHFLAARREDHDLAALSACAEKLESRFSCHIELLAMPEVDVSSTMIRNRCAHHQSIRGLTPDPVAAYIEEYGLYQWEGEKGAFSYHAG